MDLDERSINVNEYNFENVRTFYASKLFHAFLIACFEQAKMLVLLIVMFQAKLSASIKWLINQVFENSNDVPDRLRQLFVQDGVHLLLFFVIFCLECASIVSHTVCNSH